MSPRKKFAIFCATCFCYFLLGIVIDLACGPQPDPYDYYISFFHNNLQKNDDYERFYFNGYTFLNGEVYEAERDNKIAEGDINVKEWMAYCGNRVTYKDIAHVLYELDKKTDSLYFRGYKKGNAKMPDSLKNNTFVKYLVTNEVKFSYLVLAKQGEPLVNPSEDDRWDARRSIKKEQYELALKYIKMAQGLHDDFLKLRCYYQAQRLMHYGKYFKEASDIYDKYIAVTRSQSHVKGWAMALKAGELGQLGDAVKAAYLYSRVFTDCTERRINSFYDFLSLKVPVESVVKQTKNNSEKAAIYAIKGLHNPHIGLAGLEQVYKTDPQSEFVSILLAREINKIEEGYLTPKVNGSKYYGDIGYYEHTKYDSVKRSFVKYIPRLKAFCNRISNERQYEPELGNLASAYLSWMQKDYKAGFTALAAIRNKHLRDKLNDQKQLINLLLLSQSIKIIDKQAENRLLPSLTWLEGKVKHEKAFKFDEERYRGEYDLKHYSASARDFYTKILAPLYFKQKDTVKAALCILKSEKTIPDKAIWEEYPDRGLGFDMPSFWQNKLHSYHLKKILGWQLSPAKSAYLKLLMAAYKQPVTRQIVHWTKSYKIEKAGKKYDNETLAATYDLLGTACLREHRYAAAVKAFKHIDVNKLDSSTNDAYNDSLSKHYRKYANPFYDNLLNYHNYSLKKTEGYNKLAYAQVMAQLQRQIQINPKGAAKNWYKMALGLYNTSYYGNAWIYTAYSAANDDKYRTRALYYDGDYLRNRNAEKWFLKARSLSVDTEFGARCTFMAAKCRQTRIYEPQDWAIDKAIYEFKTSRYEKALRNNFYFTTLKVDYSKTKFYKTAINECSYFRDFLASAKPAKKGLRRADVVTK